tara:strand:+ start:104 stop:382 length:279 start_codon:yes stop_codon:yes gene_type:complete
VFRLIANLFKFFTAAAVIFAVIVLIFVVKENPNSYSFWLMIGGVVFIVFLLGTVAVQIVIMNEITRIREIVEGGKPLTSKDNSTEKKQEPSI